MRDNQFGSLVVARNYATMDQVYECLAIQQQYQAVGGPVPKLGEIMAMKGYMTPQQVQEILASFQGSKVGLFGDLAIRMRLATKEQVDYCLAVQRDSDARNLPHKKLGEIMVQYNYLRPYQVEQILGSQTAKSQRCYSCGNEFSVGPFRADTQLQCPNCRAINIVGSNTAPAGYQPPAPVQIPAAAQHWQNQLAAQQGGGLMGQVSFAGAGRMPAGSGVGPAVQRQMFPSPAGGVQQPLIPMPQNRASESQQAANVYSGYQGGPSASGMPPRLGTSQQGALPHAPTVVEPANARSGQHASINPSRSGSQSAVDAARSGSRPGVGRTSGGTARASGANRPSIMRPTMGRPSMGRTTSASASGSRAVPIAPQPAVRKQTLGLGVDDDIAGEMTSVTDVGTFSLANYQMVEKLDSEGMGVRFKGRHSRTGDLAEVFVLDAGFMSNAPFLAQWLGQSRRAMMLEHPNLSKLLFAGNDNKNHYAIQEYIEGRSVKKMIYDLGPFQPKEALDVVWQACQGLRYAHDQGLFHGFLSPSSVLIGMDGRSRVTNLGLLVDGVRAVAAQVAAQGQIDIPIYLAPELTIEGQRADQRSDIYSLGAILFHMLTGQAPLVGDSATAVLMKAAENDIPTLSSVRPDLPGFLDEIITKMMAVEATERYQSMMQLAGDLLRARQAVDSGAEALTGGAVGSGAVGDRDGSVRFSSSATMTARGRTGKKKKKKKGQTIQTQPVDGSGLGASSGEGKSILEALEGVQQNELAEELNASAAAKRRKRRRRGAERESAKSTVGKKIIQAFIFLMLVAILGFILIRLDIALNKSRYWDKMKSVWHGLFEKDPPTPPTPGEGLPNPPVGVPVPPGGTQTPPDTHVTPPPVDTPPPVTAQQSPEDALAAIRAENDPARKILMADAFAAQFPDSDKLTAVTGQKQLAQETLAALSYKDLVQGGFEADDLIAARKFNEARAKLKAWADAGGNAESVQLRSQWFGQKLDKAEANAFTAIGKQVRDLVAKNEFDAAGEALGPVQDNFDPGKYGQERVNLVNHIANAKSEFDNKQAAAQRAEMEAAARAKREAEAQAVYGKMCADLQNAFQILDEVAVVKAIAEAKPKLVGTTYEDKFMLRGADMQLLLKLRNRMLDAINDHKLSSDTISYQQQDAQVIQATREMVTLKLAEGESEMKWKAISPLALSNLMQAALDETNAEDMYELGIWREYMGNIASAKLAYNDAIMLGHEKARDRLAALEK